MSAAPPTPDRRVRARRAAPLAPGPDELWFGTLDPQPEASASAGEPVAPQPDRRGRDDATESQPPPDVSEEEPQTGQTTFERIYRTFIASRAALGFALVVTLGVARLFGLRPTPLVSLVSIAYAVLAISMWLLPRFRGPLGVGGRTRLHSRRWLATIGADLICFTALHLLAAGSSLNYQALLVLPVLMSGILTPRLTALATAAGVTLILLSSAWFGIPTGGDTTALMTQAGLAGSGFFVITVLAGELARRLAREEMSARGSLELARQQAQLNQLVIEEMQDGVLVVDRRGRVRAANPAARRLLAAGGIGRAAPFQLRGVPAWEGLVRTVERAFSEATWPAAGRDVALAFEQQPAKDAARARPLHTPSGAADERGVLRPVSRGRPQHAGAQPAGKTGCDGTHLGRHRARDPQSAGRHRPGQRAAFRRGGRALAAAVDPARERQRRALEAHRRRCDGGCTGTGAAGRCNRRRPRWSGRSAPNGRGPIRSNSATAALCASICRAKPSASRSIPSICVACSSTCSTTRIDTRPVALGRLRFDSMPATSCRIYLSVLSDGAPIPVDVEPIVRAIFLDPQPWQAPDSACTFAASSANVTAPASTTAYDRMPVLSATGSSST